jgi:hypothetical protein
MYVRVIIIICSYVTALQVIVMAFSTIAIIAGSIDEAPLRFNAKLVEYAVGDVHTLLWPIVSHYISQGISEGYKLLGSFEFLGTRVHVCVCVCVYMYMCVYVIHFHSLDVQAIRSVWCRTSARAWLICSTNP